MLTLSERHQLAFCTRLAHCTRGTSAHMPRTGRRGRRRRLIRSFLSGPGRRSAIRAVVDTVKYVICEMILVEVRDDCLRARVFGCDNRTKNSLDELQTMFYGLDVAFWGTSFEVGIWESNMRASKALQKQIGTFKCALCRTSHGKREDETLNEHR